MSALILGAGCADPRDVDSEGSRPERITQESVESGSSTESNRRAEAEADAEAAVDPAVRRQIDLAERRVAEVEAAAPAVRASAVGDLAQLLHAYDLEGAAAARYAEARALDPDAWQWPYGLALLALERGDGAAGRRWLETVLAIVRNETAEPAAAAARLRLAALDLEAAATNEGGARNERLDAAAAGFAARPGDAWALRGLGRVALERGDLVAARTAFESALAASPGADRLHYELAQVERRAGNLDRAAWHLERFGATEPQLDDPYLRGLERLRTGTAATLQRAASAFLADRPEEAVALLEPLEAERMRDPQLTAVYTAALLVTEAATALDELERATRRFPEAAELHLQFASASARHGRPDAALDALETVARLEPQNESAALLQADLLRQIGRFTEAIEPYRRALVRQPENVLARLYLGSVLAATGALDEAAAELETALRLAPGDPLALDELARVEVRRAEAARGRGDEAAALEAATRAHGLLPDDPDLRRGLARLLATADSGDPRDGRRALELVEPLFAVERSPYDAEIVAMAHAAAGNFSTALDWQRNLLSGAGQSRDVELVERLRRNLERYERGEVATLDP